MAKTEAWITKHALTKGIVCEVGVYDKEKNIFRVSVNRYTILYFSNNFHLTKKAAEIRANAMREKKIQTLEKEIAKLEKITF